MIALPIDAYVAEIVRTLDRSRALVVVAEPGAGKTTRVPPALAEHGRVILLEPRRVAARAIASRIAEERKWTLGREVGWQMRFERRFGPETRLLVATEGILTARLQRDPLLSSFQTIVLDEFHERSIHADLGIALAKQAWLARDDLRLVVMSATIDAHRVATYLGGCPVIDVKGRSFPIDVSYRPDQTVSAAAAALVGETTGDVLCFVPGTFDIQKTLAELGSSVTGVELLGLHGSMPPSEQDRVFHPSGRRRVVVATNVAETSITVPNVAAVVDSGLHKVARYDAARGVDSLVTERITQDSADQRAGRAGRLQSGVAVRLWSATDRLRRHREPELHRVDLSSTLLDIISWGGDPYAFDWFDAPPAAAIDAALALLKRLGALTADERVSEIGKLIERLPLQPRLARILIAGEGRREYARVCAMLSERSFLPPRSASTTSDLLSALDEWDRMPPHIARVAREIEQLAARVLRAESADSNAAMLAGPASAAPLDEREFRQAIFAGYADRVAQRRGPGSARVRLASGAGAVIAAESGVGDGEFLAAVDLQSSTRQNEPDARVRVASRVEREWLEPTHVEIVHVLDGGGVVRAAEVRRYGALVIGERNVAVDAEVAANLIAEEYLRREPPAEDRRLLQRLAFAGQAVQLADLVRRAAAGVRALSGVRLEPALTLDEKRALGRDAPDSLVVPSGRTIRLDYRDDGSVSASVKLQELFGLAETPRIGSRREPVLFQLLAPNGRPVQLTRDLRSFWNTTYPEVRKELRGRYPKHPWPEDPWNAPPTSRTTGQSKRLGK